jgi:methionyl-tRNA formyltransferase
MRVIFMGSPDFSVPTLDALVAAGHEIIAVYTQPSRPAGRGKELKATAVNLRAQELGLEVRSPKSLRDEDAQAAFAALNPDVAVVAAYGIILPQAILDAPRHGCINVHASLLPRWRGAAPVQRAIMAGDRDTGITIMQMEIGLDTGPIRFATKLPINGNNAAQITEQLAVLGAEMMVDVLADLDSYPPLAQPEEGVTYAAKISKGEARVDWSRPAEYVQRQVQGLAPFPGAWFDFGGERIKLLDSKKVEGTGNPGQVLDDHLTVACGNGALQAITVQRAGKGALPVDELLRGFPIPRGTLLT